MPRVCNKRVEQPRDSIYIGRPSKWGNPYAMGPHSTREQVIQLYRELLLANPHLLEVIRRELAGKDLVCWCAPAACHGDVLLRVANGGEV